MRATQFRRDVLILYDQYGIRSFDQIRRLFEGEPGYIASTATGPRFHRMTTTEARARIRAEMRADLELAMAKMTGADEAHHFDPLYLGGGHQLIANLPAKAHDSVHTFFDKLALPDLPSVTPRGASLQPAHLQSTVRANINPAVVIVGPKGEVSYRSADEEWKL